MTKGLVFIVETPVVRFPGRVIRLLATMSVLLLARQSNQRTRYWTDEFDA